MSTSANQKPYTYIGGEFIHKTKNCVPNPLSTLCTAIYNQHAIFMDFYIIATNYMVRKSNVFLFVPYKVTY